MRAGDRAAVGQVQGGAGADPLHPRAGADLDAGAFEDSGEHGSGLGLLLGEDPVRGLHQRDAAAQL